MPTFTEVIEHILCATINMNICLGSTQSLCCLQIVKRFISISRWWTWKPTMDTYNIPKGKPTMKQTLKFSQALKITLQDKTCQIGTTT